MFSSRLFHPAQIISLGLFLLHYFPGFVVGLHLVKATRDGAHVEDSQLETRLEPTLTGLSFIAQGY